jgi:hypothetical protein
MDECRGRITVKKACDLSERRDAQIDGLHREADARGREISGARG